MISGVARVGGRNSIHYDRALLVPSTVGFYSPPEAPSKAGFPVEGLSGCYLSSSRA
jgi:hypothetical protein